MKTTTRTNKRGFLENLVENTDCGKLDLPLPVERRVESKIVNNSEHSHKTVQDNIRFEKKSTPVLCGSNPGWGVLGIPGAELFCIGRQKLNGKFGIDECVLIVVSYIIPNATPLTSKKLTDTASGVFILSFSVYN